MGPEKKVDPNSLEVGLDELPTDITSYMDVMKAHGVSDVLKASLEAVLKMSPRPKDPVAALGRLISEQAALRSAPPVAKPEAGGDEVAAEEES